MANLANVSATFMEHLCTCGHQGYSQEKRWDSASRGSCMVECEGRVGELWRGDRDCSSAVLDAWNEVLRGTAYEGALHAASYTGNMRSVLVGSGLFTWEPMSFIAQRGDIYLSEACHTAMCVNAVSDMLAELSSNKFGSIAGGEPGYQTSGESVIHGYYDFPWDGILHYTGAADRNDDDASEESEAAEKPAIKSSVDIDALAQAVINGEYCNGDAQRAALGSLYDAVQARLNEMLA